MPRNSSGNYSLPEGAFQPNTTISSSAMNSDLSDIADALTDSVATNGVSPITAPLKNPSGTSAAPGVSFSANTAAGLYNPGTGKVGLVAGGLGELVNSTAVSCTVAVVAAGGADYAVGDRITLTGGTYITPVTLTVATLSGSAVATATITTPGRYTTAPTSPVSQGSTTGAGTGATFTLTFASTLLITDLTGVSLGQALGASPYATNTILQIASADDLRIAAAGGLAAVANGGTGRSSLTPYAPIFGGTTATGAMQVGSLGTAGQVLTSNGAGSIATFQAATTPAITSVVEIRTSSATITIPSNATKCKVTLVGGGGGGGGVAGGAVTPAGPGSGAGALIKYLSGLTGGNTFTLVIGTGGSGAAAGNNTGSNGVATVLSSGTQTITTLTAGGGFGGSGAIGDQILRFNSAAGTSTNGDLNIAGSRGTAGISASAFCEGGSSGLGFGSGGFSTDGNNGGVGTGYGSGGSGGVTNGSDQSGGAGAAGCATFEWYV